VATKTTAVQIYKQSELKQANLDVLSGKKVLTIETNDVATRLSDVNIAGLVLLKNALDDLLKKPQDMSMAASMFAHKYVRVSPKQKKYLTDMLKSYLGIETIEAAVEVYTTA
jgi:hypothetical protein